MIQIAVLGHGVVGSGVCEVVLKNHESIKAKCGKEIVVKKILDLREFKDLSYADRFTKNFNDILEDDTIEIVVEVMGGLNPSYEYVSACLKKGKSVVTSNKELVATKGAELLRVAKENNVNFFFEASVGGGIPIIRPLHQCLAANTISEIVGILNGTTNYILTRMINDGVSFENALAKAQELGYAERNPAADVEGHDTARKISILGSLAFGKHISPDQVHTEGITNVTLADVEYAGALCSVIKLIGYTGRMGDGQIQIMVAPCLISTESQLARVDDVFNGILVRGDAIGDVVFYGRGAGKLPTASAVVADVIDAVKAKGTSKSLYWSEEEAPVQEYETTSAAYFLRIQGDEARLKGIAYSIKALKVIETGRHGEIGVTIASVDRQRLEAIIVEIEKQGAEVCSTLRMLDC